MIFYFSATGNCKHVAERIAAAENEPLCAIPAFQGSRYSLAAGELLGIVTPTYAWELPSVTREFLQRVQFDCPEGAYCFSVSTYGTTPGATGAEVRHWLKAQGVALSASYSVQMPDTWTPFFDLSDPARVAQQNKRAEEQLEQVAAQISARAVGNRMHRAMPYAVRLASNPFYDRMRETRNLRLEEGCVGCGLCAKKCPVQAIRMENRRPVWAEKRCAMCLGCLHRCPKFAIQYGSCTKAHGQYRNPHTTV